MERVHAVYSVAESRKPDRVVSHRPLLAVVTALAGFLVAPISRILSSRNQVIARSVVAVGSTASIALLRSNVVVMQNVPLAPAYYWWSTLSTFTLKVGKSARLRQLQRLAVPFAVLSSTVTRSRRRHRGRRLRSGGCSDPRHSGRLRGRRRVPRRGEGEPGIGLYTDPEKVDPELMFLSACQIDGAAETKVCVDAKADGYLDG